MGNRLTSQDLDQLTRLNVTAVAVAQRVTATTNAPGVELPGYKGDVLFMLNASATEGAGQTANIKIQHSDTLAGTYTEAGVYFDQVTTAGGASVQNKLAPAGSLKRYVRAVATLGGSTPAVTFGVSAISKKPAA